jgi:formate dehydrogenase subunit gamma
MNKDGRGGWRPSDTDSVVRDVTSDLTKAINREMGEEVAPEQVDRLKEKLAASLKSEAAASVRRVHRTFQDSERQKKKAADRLAKKRKAKAEGTVERLSLHLRVQHMILFTSTIILIVTGLPLKFHDAAISVFFVQLVGGPQVTRFIHRIGAIGLTFIGAYHLFYTTAFESGRKDFGLLVPKLQDLKDFLHQVGYFLGLKKDKPLFGRFSYIEKFDYWAVYWGMVVMITSGYILWFKVQAINQFGISVYAIAVEAHSDEALLATLAIVIWHFYNVHFNPKRFPGSLTWWNGRMKLDEFKEEHPLEYEDMLRAGTVQTPGSSANAGDRSTGPAHESTP